MSERPTPETDALREARRDADEWQNAYAAAVVQRDEAREAGGIAVLQKLMAERGFRVSRGIYVHPNGDHLPKWAIDRIDTPAWGGVWQPWELNDESVEDGELQTLFRLCATALTKWDADAWMHDVEGERGAGFDAVSQDMKS